MEPELSAKLLPPNWVSLLIGKPATCIRPALVGALPKITMAPQSPGCGVDEADVNTTGLSAVPLINSLDPTVIISALLAERSAFTCAKTVIPAGMVSVALFLT